MALARSCNKDDSITIQSGESLTIENAAELALMIRESLEQSHCVEIQFDPNLEMDITALQILCSGCKTAAVTNKVLSFSGARPEVLGALITASGSERHAICKHNNNSVCIWFGGI